jgi:hypothetical protein
MGKSVDRTRDDYRDKETDVSSKSSAELLAEETGRDKEEFEPPEDVDYPDPDELETEDPEKIGQDEHIPDMADEETIRYPQSETADSSEWKGYAVVALLSFVVGLLWGGRNE